MSNQKHIANSVQDLINSGFASVEPKDLFISNMVVHDLWKNFKHKFPEQVIEDVERISSKNTIHEYDVITKNPEKGNFVLTLTRVGLNPELENQPGPTYFPHIKPVRALNKWCDDVEWSRKLYITKYIGFQIDKGIPVESGIKHMSGVLFDLSLNGHIKGNLMPLGLIDLYDGSRVIMSYLLFDDDGIKYLEDNNIDFKEGGMPPKLP